MGGGFGQLERMAGRELEIVGDIFELTLNWGDCSFKTSPAIIFVGGCKASSLYEHDVGGKRNAVILLAGLWVYLEGF